MKKRTLLVIALACLFSFSPAARSQGSLDEALAAARAGRTAEGLAAVDAALEADPADARAHFTRGVILAENGRRDEAATVFQNLIDHHPELPDAYNNLAVLQAANGDFDAAVATLKSALATDTSYQTAYENLTRIFAQLASEAYSRALEVETPPAREEVELQMLADLSRAFDAPTPAQVPEPADERVADTRVTPAEPVLATPVEPVAETPPVETEVADTEPADEATVVESEDLALAEMESPASETADLAGVVDDWAQAWSDQRVDDFLAFYADGFVPDNGMSRGDWEVNRRDRIGKPDFIKVEVAILDSTVDGADRAKITFLQAYESNSYSDQVTKTLTLVRDGAAWKILEEKSGS